MVEAVTRLRQVTICFCWVDIGSLTATLSSLYTDCIFDTSIGDRWEQVFCFAGFVLDPDRAALHGPDGSAIKLRPKAFKLLKFLVANNRRAVSKRELMEAVWPGIHVGEDSLFQCIREIRSALGDTQRHMIKLVSGRGYVLTAEVSTKQESANPQSPASDTPITDAPATYPVVRRHRSGSSKALALGGAALFCMLAVVFGFTVSSPGFGDISGTSQPVIEVLPIVDTAGDAQSAALAQSIAAQMINGLTKIDGIRLIVPNEREPAASAKPISSRSNGAGFLLQGELQRSPQAWIFRTRFINASSGAIESAAQVKLDAGEPDRQRLASRLAAGAGYELAIRLNKSGQTDNAPRDGAANVAIQQASASINQTTHERFATARSILEKYLAEQPDNVDLQIALAALHLRGIQLAWYDPAESRTAENDARSLLEHALKARPNWSAPSV